MQNTNNISPSNPYYHEEVTYDSKKENWTGVASLLLVPLFILLVGAGVVSTFKLPANGGNNQNNLQIGIGGGPQLTPTKYQVPSITLTPGQLSPLDDTEDGLYMIQ